MVILIFLRSYFYLQACVFYVNSFLASWIFFFIYLVDNHFAPEMYELVYFTMYNKRVRNVFGVEMVLDNLVYSFNMSLTFFKQQAKERNYNQRAVPSSENICSR